MKMEPTVSSETSAVRTQTAENYAKRNKLHLEQGESLKTRTVLSSILRILDPFINIDHPASYKAAGHRSRYFCRLQLEHKAAALALDPTHCSHDKHLADYI